MHCSQALQSTKDRRTLVMIIAAIIKCTAQRNKELVVKIGGVQ